jgi:MFS family permease
MKAYKQDFGYTDNTTVSAVMVSLQNVGAFIAALGIFPISERYGRKKTIQVACTVFVTGVILQTIPSHSLPCFYVGRFVAGLGLGGATAVVPSYNAEQAPKEIRGRLGSAMQWLFALGVMISYWVDYATVQTLPISSAQWQTPVGLQMVPACALGFGLIFQKESIRWLAKKGRYDEAWENLKWMRADAGPEVKAEFEEIRAGIEEEALAREGFANRELFEPANRYRLALAFGVFLGQQCTGMTARKCLCRLAISLLTFSPGSCVLRPTVLQIARRIIFIRSSTHHGAIWCREVHHGAWSSLSLTCPLHHTYTR